MQRRQLIKCLTAGALFSSLLPAFATEPVTLKVGASPLVTGDILEFVKHAGFCREFYLYGRLLLKKD